MKSLKKIYQGFSTVEKWFMFILFFFICVAVVVNTICRKIFGISFSWIDELSRYVMLITACLGMSLAVTSDSHLRMDSLLNSLKGNTKLVFRILADIIFLVFVAVCAYYTILQLQKSIKIGIVTSTLKIKFWPIFAFIPLGFCGATVRGIFAVIFDFMGFWGKDPRISNQTAELEALLENSQEVAGEET